MQIDGPVLLAAGQTHHQAGRLDRAAEQYQAILSHFPNQPEALLLLGMVRAQQQDLQQAIGLLQRAIAAQPSVLGHKTLGDVLNDAGNPLEAIEQYQRAIDMRSQHPMVFGHLAKTLAQVGRHEEALPRYRQAIDAGTNMSPRPPSSWFALQTNEMGISLASLGRLDEARQQIRTALALQPDLAHAHNNLGLILMQQGQLAEAITSFTNAIQLDPKHAAALSNMGIAQHQRGDFISAVQAQRRSLEIDPRNLQTLANLTNSLGSLGEMDEAISVGRAMLEMAPQFSPAHQALGSLLQNTGRLDEALACFNRAVELNPDDPAGHSGRIFLNHFHPRLDAAEQLRDLKLWNDRHARALLPNALRHSNAPNPDRQLRVGFISPDFTNHVLANLMLPLMTHLDRTQFELFLYSDVKNPRPLTDDFRKIATQWRSSVGVSDAVLADMIRADQIDILVDLTMHMQGNRLLVFACKPAPVQITWCYPGSTGLAAMDYRITDPYLDPPGNFDDCYSEKSVRLPDTFFCYDAMAPGIDPGPAPFLAAGHITFGCLNNFCKVNPAVIAAWATVLREVEGSKILVLSPHGQHRKHLEQAMSSHGISADRVEHIDRHSRLEYLQLYQRIDIALDTFPYNGHTTSLDALWMGVPVITLAGSTVVGRAGVSQLSNLQSPELIGHTVDQYVDRAIALSADRVRLTELHQTLRQRMLESPLIDAVRFARNMGAAYRQVWQAWCRGQHDE